MKNQSSPVLAMIFGVALALVPAAQVLAGPAIGNPNLLWYDKPATKWVQALPVGNGRLGAMIFGQPASDRLQLNDSHHLERATRSRTPTARTPGKICRNCAS